MAPNQHLPSQISPETRQRPRSSTGCSITGGMVYRGSAIPEIAGQYFFSDFCGGWLRSVTVEAPYEITDWTPDVGVPGQVVGFGTDRAGEIYVLTTSEILKVVPQR